MCSLRPKDLSSYIFLSHFLAKYLHEYAVTSKPDKDLADLILLHLTDLNILDVR